MKTDAQGAVVKDWNLEYNELNYIFVNALKVPLVINFIRTCLSRLHQRVIVSRCQATSRR